MDTLSAGCQRPVDPVQHALAAGEDLLQGILWLQQAGPQDAGVLAWGGRKCLDALDVRSFPFAHRLAFLTFRDACKPATKGSSTRWDAMAVDRALTAFREAVAGPALPESGVAASALSMPAQSSRPPKSAESALRAFNLAQEKISRGCTDREAYDWLKDDGPEDYDPLPAFETWTRNLRLGRKFYGQQKNRPRAGRAGRSMVRREDVEPPTKDD